MKLFISADIEGTTGIAHWDETTKNHPDWKYFSDQMSREVAAACEGAINAGCTEILVKDAHDSARNIDPRALPDCARLFRGWSRTPDCMMAGLDNTFDGVIFTGYHSGAGLGASPLSHTMNGGVYAIQINGVKTSELLINALIASYYGVPVLCVTGDKGVCDFIKSVNPLIETVPVNEGVGDGVISIHPELAIRRIRQAAERALQGDLLTRLYPMPGHFFVRVGYKRHQDALSAAQYPGVTQVDDTTVSFASDDFAQVNQTFKWIL